MGTKICLHNRVLGTCLPYGDKTHVPIFIKFMGGDLCWGLSWVKVKLKVRFRLR